MNLILGILAFIIMLSVIILIHEGGHFIMAKKFGVYCHEFALGMGPAIFQKKKGETTYSLRAIPIGGYVMMAGESDGQDEPEWQKDLPADRRLNNKPAWQQILVMAAGVIMNFILATVLIVGYFSVNTQIMNVYPVVEEVIENGAGQAAGLQAGDEILSLTNQEGETIEVTSQQSVMDFVNENEDTPLTVLVDRKGEELELELTPSFDEESGRYLIGYIAKSETVRAPFLQGIQIGFERLGYLFSMMFQTLGELFGGQHLNELSGPVGIYQVTSQSVSLGFGAYILLIAMISINIGIFNLLPIPALDGGRIVMVLYEKVFKRKISIKVEQAIMVLSMVLLLSVMVLATYNDIIRLFN